jgi:Holliday junction resolvasome RuvABC endonuclease subunit
MKKTTYPDLILAVTLSARGFAYVFFEAPQTPFDWAIVEIKAKGKNERVVAQVHKLLKSYKPATLVLENIQDPKAKHSNRLKMLSHQLAHLAQSEGVHVAQYGRLAIRNAFAPVGAKSKVEIAEAIAQAIPAFAHRLPPVRKIWMSEDSRQMLFDAAALGMTHQQISI